MLLKDPDSEAIIKWGYDSFRRLLIVWFSTGSFYAYWHVPPAIFAAGKAAESKEPCRRPYASAASTGGASAPAMAARSASFATGLCSSRKPLAAASLIRSGAVSPVTSSAGTSTL